MALKSSIFAIIFLILLVSGSGVYAQSGTLSFELMAASDVPLGLPHDIVLSPDKRSLYVADNANHRIVVLDAAKLRILKEFAAGEVVEPHDVVFDASGRLLVADTGNSRIAIYRIDGDDIRLSGEIRGRIRRPEGVAVHPDGRVFATGSASGNLVVFKDGKVVGETGGFSSPHDVAFDRQGVVWVADAGNDRIVALDESLKVTQVYAADKYAFNGPRYIGFDRHNRMYAADKYSNSIKVIAEDGRLVRVLGRKSAGKGENLFYFPEGVEIRGNDVWFSDTYNNRVVRYRVTEK